MSQQESQTPPQGLAPLFIGLPGAGKTTLGALTAQAMGREIIGTDPLFRVFRAIPSSERQDPRAQVMRNFLTRAQSAYPALYEALEKDATTLDGKGRCALHDSAKFRSYGEDVFRLFEIEMLKWLDADGAFIGKIVDLSASAPLYEENRILFAKERFYLPILVDTPREQIAKNLVKDYRRYRQQSAAAGEKKPIRGAYEKAMDEALGELPPDGPEAAAILLKIAAAMTEKEAARRLERYKAFTQNVAVVPEDGNLQTLAAQIVALCDDKSSAGRTD